MGNKSHGGILGKSTDNVAMSVHNIQAVCGGHETKGNRGYDYRSFVTMLTSIDLHGEVGQCVSDLNNMSLNPTEKKTTLNISLK